MGSDMMSLCRLCLMENTIMLPIFGEDGKHRRIREMIKESLNIALFQTDPLPRKICCKCYFKLQQANELKSDCQKSTKVLINHMNAQRSADAAKMIKTLNYQLQILHGNAPPGEPQKEPEAFGPSRVVVASASGGVGSSSTNHFPQSIRFVLSIEESENDAGPQLQVSGVNLLAKPKNNPETTAAPPATTNVPQDLDRSDSRQASTVDIAEDDNKENGAPNDSSVDEPGPPSPAPLEIRSSPVVEEKESAKEMETGAQVMKEKSNQEVQNNSQRKTKNVFFAKKSTTTKTKRPKKKPDPAEMLLRELKKLDTDSKMRIDEEELQLLSERKRPRSSNSFSHTPEKNQPKIRKAAMKAEERLKKLEDGDFSDEDNFAPDRKRRKSSNAASGSLKVVIPQSAKKVRKTSLPNPLQREGLTESEDGMECAFCLRWIKIDPKEKYFSHMRNCHPEIDEYGWAFKPTSLEIKSEKLQKSLVKVAISCQVCDRQFDTNMQLKRHLEKLHALKTCCGQTFNEDEYLDHQVMHELGAIDIDDDTPAEVDAEAAAQVEALSLYNSPLPLKENLKPSNKITPKTSAIDEPRKDQKAGFQREQRKYPSKCKKCIFNGSQQDVYYHYEMIHNDFWCVACQDVFDDVDDLEDHFVERHGGEYNNVLEYYDEADDVKERPCSACDKRFVMKGRLLYHYKTKHDLCPCFICTEAFRTEEQLREHSRVCEKKCCYVCKKKFAHKVLFVLHVLEHIHKGEVKDVTLKLQCPSCNDHFSSAELLEKHKKEKHAAPNNEPEQKKRSSFVAQPVTCKNCFRNFLHPRYLQRHICPETLVAPSSSKGEVDTLEFGCEMCEKRFASGDELENHLGEHMNF
ncbi:uncharacterized protein LOC132197703 isoform X2 [Neocloeon triangulifer]|uniref:uncharacterized protein LOC132197703 isoform X2 n=1 Tax=Neocloeon triangulifer TaxID=2078957 RepID=UPI00286F8A98|nr:uncharacterized protein LOC132197703 isoform X2 [Neocloeon triangulifer]